MPRLRYIEESEKTPHTRELIELGQAYWRTRSARG